MRSPDMLPTMYLGRVTMASDVLLRNGEKNNEYYYFTVKRFASYSDKENMLQTYPIRCFKDEPVCADLESLIQRGLQQGDNIVLSCNVVFASNFVSAKNEYEYKSYLRINQIEFANDDAEMDVLRISRKAPTAAVKRNTVTTVPPAYYQPQMQYKPQAQPQPKYQPQMQYPPQQQLKYQPQAQPMQYQQQAQPQPKYQQQQQFLMPGVPNLPQAQPPVSGPLSQFRQ